jgi:hypothetical protein
MKDTTNNDQEKEVKTMIKVNKFIYRNKFAPEIVLTQEEFDHYVKSYCNELMRSKEDFFAWLWDAHLETEADVEFWLIKGYYWERDKIYKRRREWRVECYEWARTALLAREYDVEEVE